MEPISAAIMAGANVLGGIFGKSSSNAASDKNYRLQKKAMNEGIQMRVADAKAAGVSPLFALGANLHSPAPVAVGDNSLGAGIAAAGQNIAQAVDAASPQASRDRNYTQAVRALNVQRLGLENELLSARIALARNNPPNPMVSSDRFLVDGQAQSGVTGNALVDRMPLAVAAVDPASPRSEPAAVAEGGYARTARGWAPIMSKDVQERMEEDFVGKIGYNIRNRIMPMLGVNKQPPPIPLKKGHVWMFDPFYMEYIQVKKPYQTFKRWFK